MYFHQEINTRMNDHQNLFVNNKTLEMPLVSDVEQCRPILYSSTDSD